jgi:crotonobetainyl-CoA:carnitine CoA-transferase CaiB-like acyl-CoA transferase
MSAAAQTRPLDNITVVDMTVNVPGPFCSTILGDLGATVIKVEPPGGDPLRHSPGMWASINRGKKSIVLDLKNEDARGVLARLAERSDMVLEGWRPGVARRLAADYPTLSARNPSLVYCSISGFGQDGPWSQRPGHDVNYLALSGYMSVQTAVEGRPWPPPVLVSDLASGLYAAIMTLAAVVGRHNSGKGAYIDLSMTESALSLLGLEVGRMGDQDGSEDRPNVTFVPHYGLFPCSDGRWFSLGIVHEDHFWKRFCEVAGLDGMADLKFQERLDQAEGIRDGLHETFITRPASEWETLTRRADVPAAAVSGLSDLFDSPQFRSRGTFVDIGLHRFLAQPARFSTGSVAPTDGPPGPGENTGEILADLGYGATELARLKASDAFGKVEGVAAS